MEGQDYDFYTDYSDLSGQTEDSNGVVHYYDEEGFEVETFVPGWGC